MYIGLASAGNLSAKVIVCQSKDSPGVVLTNISRFKYPFNSGGSGGMDGRYITSILWGNQAFLSLQPFSIASECGITAKTSEGFEGRKIKPALIKPFSIIDHTMILSRICLPPC